MTRRLFALSAVLLVTPSLPIVIGNPFPLYASSLKQESAPQQQTPDQPALKKAGGDVHAPVLIKSAELQYKHSGSYSAVVGLIVTEKGGTENVHIVHSSGQSDFDRSAMDTVSHYRFRPATKAGQPIRVQLNVAVNSNN
jgi:TonB family protein